MKAIRALSLLYLLTLTVAQRDYRYEDLRLCELSTVELNQLEPNDVVEPCIIFDIQPDKEFNSTLIPLVQVTPSNCGNHRDGAVTAIQKLNSGWNIGFYEDHLVQFSLVSVLAGNPASLTLEEYDRRHQQLLRSVLQATGAPYIIGSCSFAAASDKEPALEFQAMVMSQVGPPGFYAPESSNPYVFGFHINSDEYPIPNIQEVGFLENKKIPIRVIYRSKSEFFYSTCQSAIDRLQAAGFTDLKAILYDHDLDDDGDGEINEFDVDFLQNMADESCASDDPENFHPAIFMCTLTEQDIILARWLDTGCRPLSMWLTAATWEWADLNPEKCPYTQGGGQWHEKFDYSDEFFDSGKQLLQNNQAIFGYTGTYDQLVSYAIPILFAQHLQAAYRVTDVPTPIDDFADPEGRERLRRAMLMLNVETIFGPVAFNNHQRNIGRGAAGTQWLKDTEGNFRNQLVSPSLQAEASTVIPAESAIPCAAGDFVNETARVASGSLLATGCKECPVDTYTLEPTTASQCKSCPGDSITSGLTGSSQCFVYEDNLLSPGILAYGYVATSLTWILAIGFLSWLLRHRQDPVVKVSQVEFLALICFGAMLSSSSVIALSLQAGSDEDTSAASAGCMAAPILYSIGWVLQYSSLSAKTYRLFQTMMNTKRMRRAAVTALHMLPIVIICVMIDLIIVIIWSVKAPLVYERMEENREIDEELNIVTISTIGRCVSSDDNFWHYAGPILGFHAFLLVGTNVLLCNVRDIADRYQEQKYVALASALMFEILLVGIPVLVSVKNNAATTFIVLTSILALDDIAVLCCIFGPKIQFQRKGLEKGVQFGESIMRESHKRASIREFSRREMSSFVSHESRSDPNISGVSPPRDGSRDEIDLSSEEEEKESGKKRRDSFTNRLNPGDRGRPLWSRFTEASTVQSIAEETSEELKKEIDPASMLASDAGRQRKSSSSKRGSNSYMMTQAGMVDPSVYAQGQNASSGEQSLSSNDSSHSIHQQPIPSFDSPQAMEQQMKVMEMTRKLMEDHERMMQATAAIMMEHKRLKEELELSKDIERSSESSAIEKSAELTVPSSTEEEPSILSPISSGKTEIQQKDSDSTKVTESASESSAASPQLAKEDS